MLLAGDVGATKTDLAVFSAERGPRVPLAQATLSSDDFESLEALVGAFLSEIDLTVERASLGVPGPVVAGQATITNLPWQVSEAQLAQALGFSSVQLINDVMAMAYAVPSLEADDLQTLNESEPQAGGAVAVIAPGTGLGEAFLTGPAVEGELARAHPSEGGHADFAPVDALQIDLLRTMLDRFDHVSYELVCSGKGIPHIYDFLKSSGRGVEPDWLAEELAGAEDRTPIIVRAASDGNGGCELCAATVDTFVSILGAEAGNLALKVLATGGVYVAGGVARHVLPFLQQGHFMAAFRRKGRFEYLMGRIPVHVVLNPRVALLGAACYGLEDARWC